jgi:hypothetical protein
MQLQRENEQLQQALASLQQELQRSEPHPKLHLTQLTMRRIGHADAAVRQALSPRRAAFKSLLKRGSASGKENSCGQTEPLEAKQQHLSSQALADVAAAAGVTLSAEGCDLRALCLQVSSSPFLKCRQRKLVARIHFRLSSTDLAALFHTGGCRSQGRKQAASSAPPRRCK